MKKLIALFLPFLCLVGLTPDGLAQDASKPGFDQDALDAKVAEILPRVEEIRGWKFEHEVPAGVTTPDEFLEFAKGEFEADYGMEKLKAMEKAYIMFGLLDEGSDLFEVYMELLRGQVGGFYDPKTKKFYMMSTFNQGGLADIIMAHELTHALDDQHFHLDKMFENALDLNADAEFALRAVVEGSGTSLMNLYTVQGMMKGYLKMDPQETMKMMEGASESLEGAPPFLIMTLSLPYLEGNKFLVKQSSILAAAAIAPTNEDLETAFNNPPVSSEQVLHPEKYWEPDKVDLPVKVAHPDYEALLPKEDVGYGMLGIFLLVAIATLLFMASRYPVFAAIICTTDLIAGIILFNNMSASPWSVSDQNTLGELGCYVVTAEELPDLATAEGQMASFISEASAGWGGDSYTLLETDDGGQLIVWATTWDTPEDCGEFALAFHQMQDENPYLLKVDEYESAVVIAFGNDQGEEVANLVCELVAAENNWQ